MADNKPAKLNSLGQLVSEAEQGKSPITVVSNTTVTNLSAQLHDGVPEADMLRTNNPRTLESVLTIGKGPVGQEPSKEGNINVTEHGKITVGDFEIKNNGGLFHIDIK